MGVICEHLDARTIIKTILLKKVIKSKIEGERDCLSFFLLITYSLNFQRNDRSSLT